MSDGNLINQTLYINGINDKISISEIKRTLFSIFSAFGTILEIRAHKGLKRRGQAWITFYELDAAVQARQALDEFYIFNQRIRVNFAKKRSQIIQKIAGNFNPYGRKACTLTPEEAKKLSSGRIPKYWDYDMEQVDEEAPIFALPEKTEKTTAPVPTMDHIPPNKILFVQNLPTSEEPETIKIMLEMFFRQYWGFVEARTVDIQPGIGFVEFDTIDHANVALELTNGMEIEENRRMFVQYAK